MPATPATTPTLRLVSARPMTAREAAVRLSVKASKAHRDRLPSMVYADRLTANSRHWDMTHTRRADALARREAAVGTTGRTLAHI